MDASDGLKSAEQLAQEQSAPEQSAPEKLVEQSAPEKLVEQSAINLNPIDGSIGAPPFMDLSQYHQPGYSAGGSRVAMLLWWLVQAIAFPLTLHTAHGIRCTLLRWFGAKVGQHVIIRPTARFTYPWNIEIGDYSWIGDDVVLYSLAPIKLGQHCVISQKSYLCTGSHDISDPRFGLVTGQIVIENGAWVATDCFIGPDVRIGANAVIGTRSTVLRSMPPGQICLGTPCRPVKPRPTSSPMTTKP